MANLVGNHADRREIDRIKANIFDQPTEDLVRAVKVFHGPPDLADVVSRWENPLIVVCGDCDLIVTEKKTADLASSAPIGQLHVMRGCGH